MDIGKISAPLFMAAIALHQTYCQLKVQEIRDAKEFKNKFKKRKKTTTTAKTVETGTEETVAKTGKTPEKSFENLDSDVENQTTLDNSCHRFVDDGYSLFASYVISIALVVLSLILATPHMSLNKLMVFQTTPCVGHNLSNDVSHIYRCMKNPQTNTQIVLFFASTLISQVIGLMSSLIGFGILVWKARQLDNKNRSLRSYRDRVNQEDLKKLAVKKMTEMKKHGRSREKKEVILKKQSEEVSKPTVFTHMISQNSAVNSDGWVEGGDRSWISTPSEKETPTKTAIDSPNNSAINNANTNNNNNRKKSSMKSMAESKLLQQAVLPQTGPLREAIIQACEIREEAYKDMACQSKKVKMMLLIFLCFWIPNLCTNLIYICINLFCMSATVRFMKLLEIAHLFTSGIFITYTVVNPLIVVNKDWNPGYRASY